MLSTLENQYATKIQKIVRRMLALFGLEQQLAPTAQHFRGMGPDINRVVQRGIQLYVSRLWMSLVYRDIEGRREAYADVQDKASWYICLVRGKNV